MRTYINTPHTEKNTILFRLLKLFNKDTCETVLTTLYRVISSVKYLKLLTSPLSFVGLSWEDHTPRLNDRISKIVVNISSFFFYSFI